MPAPEDPLSRAETGDLTKFSRLEASLVKTEVEQRPNSRAQDDVNRHAETTDIKVNELEFEFDLNPSLYPLNDLKSLQQVFDAVQCHHHLKNQGNFSLGTHIECLNVDSKGGGIYSTSLFMAIIISILMNVEWQIHDEMSMDNLLQQLKPSVLQNQTSPERRLLVLYVCSHQKFDTMLTSPVSCHWCPLRTPLMGHAYWWHRRMPIHYWKHCKWTQCFYLIWSVGQIIGLHKSTGIMMTTANQLRAVRQTQWCISCRKLMKVCRLLLSTSALESAGSRSPSIRLYAPRHSK